jgi:uncharacterized protein YcfJ
MTNVKNKKSKTALAVVSLAAMAFATPLSASASDYQKCKDTINGVAGGVIGGSAGAAIGESIAGRGNRTEGAVLGAIIGGIAGAALGDSASDCEKYNRSDRRVVTTTNHYPTRTTTHYPARTTTTRGYQTVGHNGHTHRPTTNRSYRSDRGYSRDRGYSTDRGYGRRFDPLYQIDREIEQTRREGDRLKRKLRNSRGHRPGLRRALEDNGRQLRYLKKERRRIKKRAERRNDYRPQQTRRGHYHGSSRNLCYSDH